MYGVSQKGKPQLIHNGFKYGEITRSLQRPGKTQWICTRSHVKRLSCKAKATTYKDENGNEHAVFRGIHNHPANYKLQTSKKE